MEIKWEVLIGRKREEAVVIAYFENKSRADYAATSLKKGYKFTEAREYTGGAVA